MSSQAKGRGLVLVVDDEPALCQGLARLLSRDFTPIVAATFDHALAAIDGHPDLVAVVTDYELDNGHNCRQILDRARATRPQAARIVVSAALDQNLIVGLTMDCLAHRCVNKPWQPAALLDLMHLVLDELLGSSSAAPLARGTLQPDAELRAQIQQRVAAYSSPRRHPRYSTTLKVLVRFPSWVEFSEAYTMNISRGGMLFQMKHAPQAGDQVELITELPGGDRIRLPSTVRHVAPVALAGEQVYRVGVCFESLDEIRDRLLAVALSRLALKPGA